MPLCRTLRLVPWATKVEDIEAKLDSLLEMYQEDRNRMTGLAHKEPQAATTSTTGEPAKKCSCRARKDADPATRLH